MTKINREPSMPYIMEIARYFDYFWKVGQILGLAMSERPAQASHDIAEVFTVHSLSGNSLNMVWATWDAFAGVHSGGSWLGFPHSLTRRIDQCMSMTDAALRYGCDIDSSIAYNPWHANPLFKLVDDIHNEVPPQAITDAFRYLCNIGYDLEQRNSEGVTILLFEASRLCPSVISTLKFLIDKGADLCTVDPYNRGALHFALGADYGWASWGWGSSCTNDCDHSWGHESWAKGMFLTESESYAQDYCNDGLTPAPSTVDEFQSNRLACDARSQKRLYRTSGGKFFPTTDLIRSESHISRSRHGQYVDLDETDDHNEDDEIDVEDEDEDEEEASGENSPREEEDETDEDNDTEDLEIPEGYVLCYNPDNRRSEIIRNPLPILKTRLRFKLLTLLRAGCDPNVVDDDGSSPSDDARYHGLWPEWTWALLNAGYVFDEGSNRWVKRSEEEVSFD